MILSEDCHDKLIRWYESKIGHYHPWNYQSFKLACIRAHIYGFYMTQWYACIIHHLVQYTICWHIYTLGACNRLLLRCICSVFVFPVFNLWCQDHNVDNTAATNPVEYFSLTYMNRVWFLCHKMCEITSFMTDFHLDNCLMQATIEPLMTQFSHMRIYVPLGKSPRYICDKDIWIYGYMHPLMRIAVCDCLFQNSLC